MTAVIKSPVEFLTTSMEQCFCERVTVLATRYMFLWTFSCYLVDVMCEVTSQYTHKGMEEDS